MGMCTLQKIFPLFLDDKSIDWREGFPQLPLVKENKLKEGSWKA
jgi:hypothetical protein